MRVIVRATVRATVRAIVRAIVRATVRAIVRAIVRCRKDRGRRLKTSMYSGQLAVSNSGDGGV